MESPNGTKSLWWSRVVWSYDSYFWIRRQVCCIHSIVCVPNQRRILALRSLRSCVKLRSIHCPNGFLSLSSFLSLSVFHVVWIVFLFARVDILLHIQELYRQVKWEFSDQFEPHLAGDHADSYLLQLLRWKLASECRVFHRVFQFISWNLSAIGAQSDYKTRKLNWK